MLDVQVDTTGPIGYPSASQWTTFGIDDEERSMLRRLVAFYLIVATLAGPRLCPCSASCDAAPNTPSIPQSRVPPSCGCCNASRTTATHASQAPGQERPDSPSAPCQCQCGKQDTASIVRAAGRAVKPSLDHDGFTGPAHTCGVPYSAPIQHAFGVGRLRYPPFYTTDDILFGFHRLRC